MTQRTPLLAGNWKMHCTGSEAARLVDDLRQRLAGSTGREVLLAPPFTALATVAERLEGSGFHLGAQNLHWDDEGAFTGEISAPMLLEAGCTHVIVGHSERRQLFGETDAGVVRKVQAALRHGLRPIVCVGETLAEREAGSTLAVVRRQAGAALRDLEESAVARLTLAYEPVWAIGTGRVATPEQAQEVHAEIRALVAESAGAAVAEGLRILYGGSVKSDNIDELMREPDVDGALIGGASLDAEAFARIVQFRD